MRRIIQLMVIFSVLLCIGTASAEEVTGSITVYLENVEGTIVIYQADSYAEKDPGKLSVHIKEQEIPGIAKPITPGSPTVFADLPQGRYLVTHNTDTFLPFFVTVPITINGTPDFTVEAWPKTQAPQSPNTGDPMLLYPFLAVLSLSLIGMTAVKTVEKKSFAHGTMFANCVQNKQKRLR